MRAHRVLRGGAIIALIAIAGCPKPDQFPVVTKDDSADRAWVRQVVPILLGRKVKGATEVKLLADLVQLTDRATVLHGLMNQPEFNEHWSEVLVNSLRIDREDTHLGWLPSQSDCYGAPLRGGVPTGALAQHVLSAAPASVATGGAFNMSDVVRSAVAADNLAPIYRGNLFALEHHSPPLAKQQARDELGRTFAEVYLNRQNTCLACHNSDFSTTGPSSSWPRFFPILGSFEVALYGASSGGDPLDIHEMFRADQTGGAGAVAPWGMSGCGVFKADMGSSDGGSPYFTGALPPGATVTTLANLFKQGYDGLALDGLNRQVPPSVAAACNTCKTSCTGTTPLDPESVAHGAFVRDLLTAHSNNTQCGYCHGGTQDLWFYDSMPGPGEHWYSNLINIPSHTVPGTRVIPGDAANSVLVKKLRGTAGARMPLNAPALADADIQKVEAWINALPPSAAVCSSCATLSCDKTHLEHPPEAFAYLTAARIVNTVWQEVMGYPLTIANYFPRNFEQRGVLWNLTESSFLSSSWSLRELLVRILTANTFNRRPPDIQSGSGSPYQMPRLYDPWVVLDPRIPPVSEPSWSPQAHPDVYHNAMTDGVYRYSAWSLLRSAEKAMDWPAPRRFPDGGYPSQQLARDLGQFLSSESQGFRASNFPELLAWEKEHGLCGNHRPDQSADWIDRLAAAAAAFAPPASDPGALTVRDVLRVERDWLLGDGTIATTPPAPLTQSEEEALTVIVGPLDATVASLQAPALTSKLRSVCGLMLETPQFMLAGIAPDGPGAPTRLRVCNGAPCSYQEMCQQITSQIALGRKHLWRCGTDSVGILDFAKQVIAATKDQRFCPECPVLQIDPRGCFDPQVAECHVTPPSCNATCNRIDCCGAPLSRVDRSGTILLVGDGATVKQASGVLIRRARTAKSERLGSATRLAYGDVLELQPGAKLVLDNAGREMTYDGEAGDDVAARHVLITSAPAQQVTDRQKALPPLSGSRLDWLRTRGWMRAADGSTPIEISPETRGPGAAEQQWKQRMQSRPVP